MAKRLSERSRARTTQPVTLNLNPTEFDWLEATRQRYGLARSEFMRLAINEAAKHLGVSCAVRLKTGFSYDRNDPNKGRAFRDRLVLLERRTNGERTADLAKEYGISPGAISSYIKQAARDLGTTPHAAINMGMRETCRRVLDDPFLPLSSRVRQVAEALAESDTYEAAALSCGVTRQRVEQVAVIMRRMGGVPVNSTKGQYQREKAEARS